MAAIKRTVTFADLPYDLRELIWKLCLPQRVFEADNLEYFEDAWDAVEYPLTNDEHPYDDDSYPTIPTPCRLWPTIMLNAKPPVIASVCREARHIALQARTVLSSRAEPVIRAKHSAKDQQILDYHLNRGPPSYRWLDCQRAMPHLYIESDFSFGQEEDPVATLASLATLFNSREASVRFMLFEKGPEGEIPDEPDQVLYDEPVPVLDEDWHEDGSHWWRRDVQKSVQEDSDSLMKCKHWHVVMGIVVIHANAYRAAEAGFFGLLGDEPIQIIDLVHQQRIKEYLNFARLCEQATGTPYKQAFDNTKHLPLDLDVAKRRLDYAMWKCGFETHLYPRLQPAIVFRLCPHACHLHTAQSRDSSNMTSSNCTPACWLD